MIVCITEVHYSSKVSFGGSMIPDPPRQLVHTAHQPYTLENMSK